MIIDLLKSLLNLINHSMFSRIIISIVLLLNWRNLMNCLLVVHILESKIHFTLGFIIVWGKITLLIIFLVLCLWVCRSMDLWILISLLGLFSYLTWVRLHKNSISHFYLVLWNFNTFLASELNLFVYNTINVVFSISYKLIVSLNVKISKIVCLK